MSRVRIDVPHIANVVADFDVWPFVYRCWVAFFTSKTVDDGFSRFRKPRR